jgi:hypothetical protein
MKLSYSYNEGACNGCVQLKNCMNLDIMICQLDDNEIEQFKLKP